jgi:hypothetical protein
VELADLGLSDDTLNYGFEESIFTRYGPFHFGSSFGKFFSVLLSNTKSPSAGAGHYLGFLSACEFITPNFLTKVESLISILLIHLCCEGLRLHLLFYG